MGGGSTGEEHCRDGISGEMKRRGDGGEEGVEVVERERENGLMVKDEVSGQGKEECAKKGD